MVLMGPGIPPTPLLQIKPHELGEWQIIHGCFSCPSGLCISAGLMRPRNSRALLLLLFVNGNLRGGRELTQIMTHHRFCHLNRDVHFAVMNSKFDIQEIRQDSRVSALSIDDFRCFHSLPSTLTPPVRILLCERNDVLQELHWNERAFPCRARHDVTKCPRGPTLPL
jgi:hypothetical protein